VNSKEFPEQPHEEYPLHDLIVQQVVKIGLFVLVLATLLFVSSGRVTWLMAWVYIGVYAAGTIFNSLLIIPRNPALLDERTRIKKDAKKWDKALAPLMAGLCPAITVTVAGLDIRFNWSPQIPFMLQIAAIALAMLGHLLLTWAMATNSFFSAIVRIQKNRGHTVVTSGPYRYVRHPGYVGIIVFALATPLILGSLWAFIPALFMLFISVVRIVLEERTLKEELKGYSDYADQVRYRLLPGIW
jgi:protein-S-isoprenylcysteine O-methyltransferase Ste14